MLPRNLVLGLSWLALKVLAAPKIWAEWVGRGTYYLKYLFNSNSNSKRSVK